MRHRDPHALWVMPLATAVALALLLAGCAARTQQAIRHQAALTIAANETALTQLRLAEQAWYSGGHSSDQAHREFLEVLLKAQETLHAGAQLLLAWQPGSPVPAQLLSYLAYAEDAGGRAQQVAGALAASVQAATVLVERGKDLVETARRLRAAVGLGGA